MINGKRKRGLPTGEAPDLQGSSRAPLDAACSPCRLPLPSPSPFPRRFHRENSVFLHPQNIPFITREHQEHPNSFLQSYQHTPGQQAEARSQQAAPARAPGGCRTPTYHGQGYPGTRLPWLSKSWFGEQEGRPRQMLMLRQLCCQLCSLGVIHQK